MFRRFILVMLVSAAAFSNASEETIRELWFNTYSGSEGVNREALDLKIDGADNAYLLSFDTNPDTGFIELKLEKFSKGNELLWKLEISDDQHPAGLNFELDRNGNSYVCFSGVITKYNPFGEKQWAINNVSNVFTLSEGAGALFVAWQTDKTTVARYSAETGISQWSSSHGPTTAEAGITVLTCDKDGNSYVTSRNAEGDMENMGRVIKFSPTGEKLVVAKTRHAWFKDIAIRDGQMFVLTSTGHPWIADLYRFDSVGESVWSKRYLDFMTHDVAVDQKTGTCYLLGERTTDHPIRIVAHDLSGNVTWDRYYERAGNHTRDYHLDVDRHGRIYAAYGQFYDDGNNDWRSGVTAHRFSPTGDIEWTLTFAIAQVMFNGALRTDEGGRVYWAGHYKHASEVRYSRWLSAYRQRPVAIDDELDITSNRPFSVAAPGPIVNDAYTSEALLIKASDTEHGKLQVGTNGWLAYTPQPGFTGTDSFTYRLNAGDTSNLGTVRFKVNIDVLKAVLLANPSVIGGDATTASIQLDRPSPDGALVNLSSNSSAVIIPASTSFPIGQSSRNVPVKTSPVSSTVTRSVSASFEGVTKSALITLTPGGLKANAVSASSVTGGNTATGTVALSGPAPAGGRVVTLSSNSSSIVVPASVTVAPGASSATYNLNTSPLAQQTTRQITARLGTIAITANLTILPAKLSRVSISPSSVKGGTNSTGTVALSGKTAANLTVALSSNSSAVVVPSSIIVPAGATSKTFAITTKPVTATATRQVTATQGGVTSTASITLTP